MIKNIFSVFFGLFLTISYAKADAVDDWLACLKSKFSGTELVFAMTSHPGTDGIQALVPEFTEKTGIEITFDAIPAFSFAANLGAIILEV